MLYEVITVDVSNPYYAFQISGIRKFRIMLLQAFIYLGIVIDDLLHPGGPGPAKFGPLPVNPRCPLHFRGERGSLAVPFVVPLRTAVDQTVDIQFVAVEEQADEGVLVVHLSVGGEEGSWFGRRS